MANGGAAGESAETDRVWLKQYADGVPADIDLSGIPSLAAVIDRACEQYRERIAFENLGASLSYDDLDRLSQDFASWLQNIAGLHLGDRVAVMMPNLLQYPIAVFGILRAGLVVVNVDLDSAPHHVQHQLKDSGARVVVVVESCAAVLAQVIAGTALETVITTQIGDLLPFPKSLVTNFVAKRIRKRVPAFRLPDSLPFRTALARGRGQPYHRVQLDHGDLAFLQYTDETTASSKGTILTHGNMVASLLQIRAWVGRKLGEGSDMVITALPLNQHFAQTVCALLFVHVGAKNKLISDADDSNTLVAELDRRPFTAFIGVDALFSRLLNHADFAAVDFSALKLTIGAGAAIQQSVAEQWKAVTGVALTQSYGPSECFSGVCCSPSDGPESNGSIGMPLPSTWVSLRDHDERQVPMGTPGELCVRGPQVTRGYWNRAAETQEAFTADHWFKTGDIAIGDDAGRFRIVQARHR